MAEQRVQRRLTAILAADVVGNSRLMGADEEGTLARLQALPEIDAVIHGPDDGLCCPSVPATLRFVLDGAGLAPVE